MYRPSGDKAEGPALPSSVTCAIFMFWRLNPRARPNQRYAPTANATTTTAASTNNPIGFRLATGCTADTRLADTVAEPAAGATPLGSVTRPDEVSRFNRFS